jgi:hypothetical protein
MHLGFGRRLTRFPGNGIQARDGEASSWMDAITTTAVMVATAAAVAVTTAAEAVGQRTSFGDEENQTEEGAKAIVYERTPSPRREPPRSPSAPAVSPGTPFSFFSPLYVPVAAATSSVMDAKQSAPGAAAMRESCSQQAPPTPVAAAMRQPSYVQEAPTTPSTPLMPPPPRPEPHFPEALPAQASSVLTALESAWPRRVSMFWSMCYGRHRTWIPRGLIESM